MKYFNPMCFHTYKGCFHLCTYISYVLCVLFYRLSPTLSFHVFSGGWGGIASVWMNFVYKCRVSLFVVTNLFPDKCLSNLQAACPCREDASVLAYFTHCLHRILIIIYLAMRDSVSETILPLLGDSTNVTWWELVYLTFWGNNISLVVNRNNKTTVRVEWREWLMMFRHSDAPVLSQNAVRASSPKVTWYITVCNQLSG